MTVYAIGPNLNVEGQGRHPSGLGFKLRHKGCGGASQVRKDVVKGLGLSGRSKKEGRGPKYKK